jgi:hypothetical protein
MKQSKWERRDKKQQKRKHGMRIDGGSVKLIVRIQVDKAEKSKK